MRQTLVLLLMLACFSVSHAWQVRKIATLDLRNAAIAAVLKNPSTGLYDVVVSEMQKSAHE